jgi:hypothetical protein
LLPQQRLYFVVPVLLPLELGLVGAGAGVGLVVVELPEVLGLDMLPLVLPLVEPLPVVAPLAPLRASIRHLSRSAPTRVLHFASASALAPALAPVLLEPDALGVELEPVVALGDDAEPEAPVLPDDEPEDCAIASEDSARRAAAVAAVRVFNIMMRVSS